MSKLYVQHDYAIKGKDYVETDGGDTPAGGVNYSTEEQDTGLKWIDGSAIYQITVNLDTAISIAANSFANTPLSNDGMSSIITVQAMNATGTLFPVAANCDSATGYVQLGNMRPGDAVTSIKTFTIQYTKTE